MPCSSQTFKAASIPVQPSQLPNAVAAPAVVAFQEDSPIVTSVLVSSSMGSNVKVVVVVPFSFVVLSPLH